MGEQKVHEAVVLRQLSMEDLETVIEWSKDDIFCLANGWETGRERDELFRWWTRCVEERTDKFIRLGVEYGNVLVGYVDLLAMEEGSAELGIAIGDRSVWGKGIGVLASRLMMDYAAKERGIHSFLAETHESNYRARRMLEKLGFQETSRNSTEEYKGKISRLLQYTLETT
ncbi:GNAT family N-acetyltransferase [Sporosarcina sp. Te-1]|uniref:GNAT family N-acetyltransferase n=1 Tax=Sporosarcina sp. Te-1 TaxID=2818390 RepID=UPI001A9D2169|nr:GNAT family N-acetyltransferase [Sporosarcina sp. Te-1]QTD41786.1 GNAT family N-acetyltransferase [Sporosarcina sp. Te-1]